MGFLDNANNLLNKETAKVGRAAKTASLNAQLKDLEKQKTTAFAHLGAALYPRFRNDPAVRSANDALFSCIEGIDAQINSIQFDMAAIERQNAMMAAPGAICPRCGQQISDSDAFCPGCGTRIEKAQAPARTANCCPRCGSAYEPGQTFCMQCGNRLS